MQTILISDRNTSDIFRLACCHSISKNRSGSFSYLMLISGNKFEVALRGDSIEVESTESLTCKIIKGEFHKSIIKNKTK